MKLWRINLCGTFLSVRLSLLAVALISNSSLFAFAQAQHRLADKSKTQHSGTIIKQSDFNEDTAQTLVRCRALFKQQNYSAVESLLKGKLPLARKYGQNEVILPKYLGMLGSSTYFQKKYKESITYAQEAIKANAALPVGKTVSKNALFGDYSYIALSLQELEQYPQAVEQFRKAIQVADSAPAGQLDQNWLKHCYLGLIYCLRRQGKYEEVLQYKERLAKLGNK